MSKREVIAIFGLAIGLGGMGLCCRQALGLSDLEIQDAVGGSGAAATGGGGGAALDGGGGAGGSGLAGGGGAGGNGDLGDSCAEGPECDSGFCVDDVCCESACEDTCSACDLVGQRGYCSPHPAGQDPESECPAGSCDGSSTCKAPGVCDGAGFCASGDYLWSTAADCDASPGVTGLATDPLNNVVLTGTFGDVIDFGAGEMTTEGSTDIFLARLAADDGAGQWSKSFGDATLQEGGTVTSDASANVHIAGGFNGTVSFGSTPLVSDGNDTYVASYDSGANYVRDRRFGADTGYQAPAGICADASGNIVLAGRFGGAADFSFGVQPLEGIGGADIFVAKLTSSLYHEWSFAFGAEYDDAAYDVAVDSSDNIIVVGTGTADLDFGGGPIDDGSGLHCFVAKFDEDGSHLWSHGYATSCWAYSVAVDSSDRIIMAGRFSGSVDFGGGQRDPAGSEDAFVLKLDSDGSYVFDKQFGNAGGNAVAWSVDTDPSGNVVLSGWFGGGIDFGGGLLVSGGTLDVYVAKLAADGTHLWSKAFGDDALQHGRKVVADAAGNVVIAGENQGTVSFGGDDHDADSSIDIFVAKFER